MEENAKSQILIIFMEKTFLKKKKITPIFKYKPNTLNIKAELTYCKC